MNAFLKSVKVRGNDRYTHIKKAITTQLSETVKEIQLCGVEENILSDSLDVEEATNSLCSVVEAMFLHGLKDSLSLRFRKAIADVDDRPDPSFWSPLLVISHKEIINQVGNRLPTEKNTFLFQACRFRSPMLFKLIRKSVTVEPGFESS